MDLRTARMRTVAVALTFAVAGVVVSALPAAALVPVMHATPTTVHAGDTIVTTGSCAGTDLTVKLNEGWTGDGTPPTGKLITSSKGVIDSSSDWTDNLVLPLGTASGSYTLGGLCMGNDNDYGYEYIEITVLADEATTTSSEAPTTVAPATTTTVPAAAAKPAAAVPAKPTYTG